MPLDPSIPLSGSQQQPSVLDRFSKAQGIQANQQQMQVQQYQISDLLRKRESAQAIQSLAGKYDLNTPQGLQEFGSEAMKVDPQMGMEIQSNALNLQKTKAEVQEKQQELFAQGLVSFMDQLHPVLAKGKGQATPEEVQSVTSKWRSFIADAAKNGALPPGATVQNTPANPDPGFITSALYSFPAGVKALEGRLGIRQKEAELEKTQAQVRNLQNPNAVLDDETIKDMAKQYLAGDTSVMQNLGRGTQGSANIVRMRKAISEEAQAQGLTPSQIAMKTAEFQGTKAGERTLGQRTANIEMAVNEAYNMIDIARQASSAYPRGKFVPLTKAQQLVDKGESDPTLAKFIAANNSLVNAFARAVSPSGVPTVSDKEHAREMLNTAMGPEAYEAVLDQMQKEMEAARKSPGQVRDEFREGAKSGGPEIKSAKAPSMTNAKGWTLHEDAQGNKAYVSPDGKQFEEVK